MNTTDAEADEWVETMNRDLQDLRNAGEERRRRWARFALAGIVTADLGMVGVAIAGGSVHWGQWMGLVLVTGLSAVGVYGRRLGQSQQKALSVVFLILAIVTLAGVVSMFSDLLSRFY